MKVILVIKKFVLINNVYSHYISIDILTLLHARANKFLADYVNVYEIIVKKIIEITSIISTKKNEKMFFKKIRISKICIWWDAI